MQNTKTFSPIQPVLFVRIEFRHVGFNEHKQISYGNAPKIAVVVVSQCLHLKKRCQKMLKMQIASCNRLCKQTQRERTLPNRIKLNTPMLMLNLVIKLVRRSIVTRALKKRYQQTLKC